MLFQGNVVVEGSCFARVLGCPGIDPYATRSNDVLDVASVLGIEAARACLENELKFVMDQHHIQLNKRHFGLLSEYMCWSGAVLGVTRHGMAKSKPGILVMASFERTSESLFSAAVHNKRDELRGVSEAVLTGQPVPLGTGGAFDLIQTSVPKQEPRIPWLHMTKFRK